MKSKYIFSMTTIPKRFASIEKTLLTLLKQKLQPEKIILNIPKKYNVRFETSIGSQQIENLKSRISSEKLIINMIDTDYGPGTKLLGLFSNNVVDLTDENTYIVLVDDDLLYRSYMLEYFNKYNNDNFYGNGMIISYYCYISKITVAQGADGIFIKSTLLKNFLEYYNKIKDFDYIKFHDDYYISYYFHLQNIPVKHMKSKAHRTIYDVNKFVTHIESLNEIEGKYNRQNLNEQVHNILEKEKNNGTFSFISSPVESIYVGPCKTDSLVVKLDKEYPSDTKLFFVHNFKDTFSYTFENMELKITRTDNNRNKKNQGWGQKLYGFISR